jgi:hypothetical protein
VIRGEVRLARQLLIVRTNHGGAGRSDGGVAAIRQVWIVSLASIIVFSAGIGNIEHGFAAFRSNHLNSLSPNGARLIVATFGILCLVGARVFEAPLDTTSDASLRLSYTRRFFRCYAFCEMPFLVGTVTSVAAAQLALYWIGAGVTLVGLVWIGPTARQLTRLQRKIDRSRSSRPLRAAVDLAIRAQCLERSLLGKAIGMAHPAPRMFWGYDDAGIRDAPIDSPHADV